jgi:hypothetical protein
MQSQIFILSLVIAIALATVVPKPAPKTRNLKPHPRSSATSQTAKPQSTIKQIHGNLLQVHEHLVKNLVSESQIFRRVDLSTQRPRSIKKRLNELLHLINDLDRIMMRINSEEANRKIEEQLKKNKANLELAIERQNQLMGKEEEDSRKKHQRDVLKSARKGRVVKEIQSKKNSAETNGGAEVNNTYGQALYEVIGIYLIVRL